jgi:hypothetical protein
LKIKKKGKKQSRRNVMKNDDSYCLFFLAIKFKVIYLINIVLNQNLFFSYNVFCLYFVCVCVCVCVVLGVD